MNHTMNHTMSHFVTIETQIRDLTAPEAACAELGVELLRDAPTRGYASQHTPGELDIRLKGPDDVDANRATAQEGEAYTLTTDWWNGHVEAEVGPNHGRLLQLHGVHKTIREASRKRLRVNAKATASVFDVPLIKVDAGKLLNWLRGKASPVFIVATATEVSQLPPAPPFDVETMKTIEAPPHAI